MDHRCSPHARLTGIPVASLSLPPCERGGRRLLPLPFSAPPIVCGAIYAVKNLLLTASSKPPTPRPTRKTRATCRCNRWAGTPRTDNATLLGNFRCRTHVLFCVRPSSAYGTVRLVARIGTHVRNKTFKRERPWIHPQCLTAQNTCRLTELHTRNYTCGKYEPPNTPQVFVLRLPKRGEDFAPQGM